MVAKEKVSARMAKYTATKAVLIKVAREVVADEGWQGAQIALIAARAKVATGSVYRYFDSKEELFSKVLASVSQREIDVIAAIINSDGPAPQRLRDAVRSFVRRALKGRRLAYALIAEPCEREIDSARLIFREAIAREISKGIANGIAAGEFVAVDPDVAASCVVGAFMEALVGPLAPNARHDARAERSLADAVASLCVQMLALPQRTLTVVKNNESS